ncbi:GTPase Der [Desulfovibrionales bacterium]
MSLLLSVLTSSSKRILCYDCLVSTLFALLLASLEEFIVAMPSSAKSFLNLPLVRERIIFPPTIALLGRPNVGKSTLFNCLTFSHRAITHGRPGVTRDRIYGEVRREALRFRLIDTGGIGIDVTGRLAIVLEQQRGFEHEILAQAKLAVAESSAVALVVDGRMGLMPLDENLAVFLRQAGKPTLVVVNKMDNMEKEWATVDFYSLGFKLLPVSAAHRHNLRELVECMAALLSEPVAQKKLVTSGVKAVDMTSPEDTDVIGREMPEALEALVLSETKEDILVGQSGVLAPARGLRLAFLGRPNVGKSSLVNALVGQERMIVSDLPGTTIDSVDVTYTGAVRDNSVRRCILVDTAGVRRKARIEDTLESLSVSSSLASSKRADVIFLVLDVSEGVTTQDKKLLDFVDKERLPFLVLVNKMDLVPSGERNKCRKELVELLKLVSYAPVLFVSALDRIGFKGLLSLAEIVWTQSGTRVGTGRLNRIMQEVLARYQAPVVKRMRAKFYYLTQIDIRPPTFIFFVNDPTLVKDAYLKYLEKQLRRNLALPYAPIRVFMRKRESRFISK